MDLLGLAKSLDGLLNYFQRERHAAESAKRLIAKDWEEALLSIHSAITETRKYFEGIGDKEGLDLHQVRNRDTEYRLSELWAIAAIRAKKFLEPHDFYDKSRYWLDGLKWESQYLREQNLKERGIDLENIERKFEELLKSRSSGGII